MKTRREIRLRRAKIIAICFGLAHLVVTLFFWSGPELAPVVGYVIDYPIACLGKSMSWLLLSHIVCSILYPVILYQISKLLIARFGTSTGIGIEHRVMGLTPGQKVRAGRGGIGGRCKVLGCQPLAIGLEPVVSGRPWMKAQTSRGQSPNVERPESKSSKAGLCPPSVPPVGPFPATLRLFAAGIRRIPVRFRHVARRFPGIRQRKNDS